jgi:parallel beta-helix repeat protein
MKKHFKNIISHYTLLIIIQFSVIQAFSANLNILELGAKPDGKTLSTKILQQAIDNCAANGGGMVIIPAGRFLTGTIILKSNTTLKLEKGAVLLGSTNRDDYIQNIPKYEALRTNIQTRQLIYSENQENISIIGEGMIDGQGSVFKAVQDDAGITRPHLIQMISCKNVRIEGIDLKNSGAWMQHYLGCDNLQIKGIRVSNFCNVNNDGIDIDGCHDVTISDCTVSSGDDSIVLKASGLRSCQNVVINNCIIHTFSSAIKFGTETTGGFQNISINNIAISPVTNVDFKYNNPVGFTAIALIIVDGGILENVNISNIVVSEISCPIFINLGNRARKYKPDAEVPPVGKIKNVMISNITAVSSSRIASSITGIPGYDIENLMFDNIRIIDRSQGLPQDTLNVVPEVNTYPESDMYGQVLPASAFYVRHVNNIQFTNTQIQVERTDYRPVFMLDDVKNITITNPVLNTKMYNNKIFKEINCKNVKVVK